MEAINSKFSVQLYELIRSRADADTAAKAVQAVEGIIESKTTQLATKEDLLATKAEIIKWVLAVFITLVTMILGLYAVIILGRH
jgi:hypothetical protein